MHLRALACLAVLLTVMSCTKVTQPREEGDQYLTEVDGVEQHLVLKPDGTYVLRNSKGEYKGTYAREGKTLMMFTPTGARAVLTMDGQDILDKGGIRWTKR